MNNTNKKLLLISISIVVVDLVTKIMALNFLPFQNQVNLIGEKVTFYLTYNMGSSGGQAAYLLRHESNKNLSLLLTSISMILLMIYIILINRTIVKKKHKWLMGIGILFVTSIISMVIKKQFPDLIISNWTTSMVTKVVGISFNLVIFYMTRNTYIRLFITIIISSGIGNLISHFYYPYRVIDFIDINGSYELLRIGVSNLADFAIDFGLCGLLITLIVIAIKKIINYAN